MLHISLASLRRCTFAAAVAIAVTPSAFANSHAPVEGKIHADALKSGEATGRYIIKFKAGSAEHRDPQAALDSAGRGLGLGLRMVRRLAIDAELFEVDRALPTQAAEAMMRALAKNPNVEFIEADALMTVQLTPNDSRYPEQWHYFEATGGINAPTAWDRTSGSGVRVAVLDTGVTAHTELSSNLVGGYDFISDPAAARDGDGRDSNPRDEGDWYLAGECGKEVGSNSSWHGTHVAGTVAAVTNNTAGVAGVAYGARVVPIRVLGKCGGALSDIAEAIVWASGGSVTGVPANSHPAEVINMSLGGIASCGSTYQTAIDSAVARGSVIIVAAGNHNVDVSNARPANCNNVVAIAATTRSGSRASFSNYGSLIDLSAPGESILSTWNSGTTTPGSQSYRLMNGTSMAAPHVAGVAALMQSLKVSTPAQIESLLKQTARALPGTCTGGCGTGIVHARAAIDAALFYQNTADHAIRDNSTVESPIAVSGHTQPASSTLKVSVRIIHTYIGDLKVDLVAPNGTIFTLHNRAGGSADNIITTYTVNASGLSANGTWWLRVNDNAGGDTGYIDSWSLQF